MHESLETVVQRKVVTSKSEFDVSAVVKRITHWLPTQAPLKDFIHQNTLEAFQNRPFHEGVALASRMYGAAGYLGLKEYRDLFQAGKIPEAALVRALRERGVTDTDIPSWKRRLFDETISTDLHFEGLATTGIRSRWHSVRGVDLDVLVHPLLFRIFSNFLDQGISIWRMPHADDRFWSAIGRIVKESWLPIPPLSDKNCRRFFEMSAAEVIREILPRLVSDPAHFEAYLLQMCLAHPGWSGMVGMVERRHDSLLARRKISLEEALALELVIEYGWLCRKLGRDFTPMTPRPDELPAVPENIATTLTAAEELTQIWHEAFEWTYYREVMKMIERHNRTPRSRPKNASVQAFFCIDDRECSLRRHLEVIEPSVETFATAGFYGVDCLFQAAGDIAAVQHCPNVLTPRHLIREKHDSDPKRSPSLSRLLHPTPSSSTLFRGWLVTQTIGISAALRLAISVFSPRSKLLADPTLTSVERKTSLHLLRSGDEKTEDGYWVGYSIEEMGDRVYNVLRSAGLTQDFAELIVFFAHGSSSANNPHFAAYNCGACSGRPGAPNARAFAWMANHPEVRAHIAKKGLHLPPGTHIVGALHDTCRDAITYFDLEELPETHRSKFEAFNAKLELALQHNAKERTRKFEMVSQNLTPPEALAHVQDRAASIFEPRPELNHATNALTVVGRREITRGLYFDRRAFMNSYNPLHDPEGETLTGILNAVVPVCGGISLEYYFSRVDSVVYGAGTKLPHNVMALIGVANGVDGDLRTGLPTQMTEAHDPLRLLIIVDQEPEIALKAAKRNPVVFEWIENGWVRYACLSPKEARCYIFSNGNFVLFGG